MSSLFLNKLLILQPCNILTQPFTQCYPPPISTQPGWREDAEIQHGAWDRADGGILLNE